MPQRRHVGALKPGHKLLIRQLSEVSTRTQRRTPFQVPIESGKLADWSRVYRDRSFRFGVVSGDVGCGKTSLLQSETVRLLKIENFTPILLTRSEVPIQRDRRRVRRD